MSTLLQDQNYLRGDQYRTSDKLDARIQLHRLYSTNHYGWYRFEYEAMAIEPGEKVLELGCGPAPMWANEKPVLADGARVYLFDLSLGMVQKAGTAVPGKTGFAFGVGDAQAVPFAQARFDLVTANHMLYHVPNIPLAIQEIRRVLKPGGRLVAATNGKNSLKELNALIRQVRPDYRESGTVALFGIENGACMLAEVFDRVETRIYEDALFVTQVEPLLDYIHSLFGMELSSDETLRLAEIIQAEIDRKGGFYIQKSTGVLLAR